MAYQRKTEDCYIIWHKYMNNPKEEIEVVTHADGGRKEAERLLKEYQLSQRGATLWMTRKRLRIDPVVQKNPHYRPYDKWREGRHYGPAEILPSTKEAYLAHERRAMGSIFLYHYPVGLNGTTPTGEGYYSHGRCQMRILPEKDGSGIIGWAI